MPMRLPDEDLHLIFSRFGQILSCEVIRDKRTGDSLQYAFIEFENQKDCEQAYFKMQGVLIDDHRIHVDFSQSVRHPHLVSRCPATSLANIPRRFQNCPRVGGMPLSRKEAVSVVASVASQASSRNDSIGPRTRPPPRVPTMTTGWYLERTSRGDGPPAEVVPRERAPLATDGAAGVPRPSRAGIDIATDRTVAVHTAGNGAIGRRTEVDTTIVIVIETVAVIHEMIGIGTDAVGSYNSADSIDQSHKFGKQRYCI